MNEGVGGRGGEVNEGVWGGGEVNEGVWGGRGGEGSPNCWMRIEEMMTPTLPSVSAKMCKKMPEGGGGREWGRECSVRSIVREG